MDISRKFVAEFLGTFWLVFGGVGSAIFAAGVDNVGIGWLGVSLAFGLTVVTMAYGIGHISGAHLNPAVTLGAFASGRISVKDVVPYIVAQCAGGVVAGFTLWFIASGKADFAETLVAAGFASNGFGENSPEKFNMLSVIITEAVLTFVFVMVILGATDWRAPAGLGGLAIGLCLTLIHLISIPVSNCSVNPARSLGTALVAMVQGDGVTWPMEQLWVFIAAPIGGAVLAGVVYFALFRKANPDD
jgi:aquaporin Z